jgi:hypoxanthine-guanine phosphoribosyltransferase
MALKVVQVEAFAPDAFEGRDVLVVDDIADEGETLRAVLDLLAGVETRTVRTADLDGAYRELDAIAVVGDRRF